MKLERNTNYSIDYFEAQNLKGIEIMRKQSDTKSRIVTSAWKLFYEQGYDSTTIDDIVEDSCTSKGSFYHYFKSKDDLPASLSYLFDEKYAELAESMPPHMLPMDKLVYLNQELFLMIENTVSVDILSKLLSGQLVSGSERSLLDSNRMYFKLLRQIAIEAKARGDVRESITVSDVTRTYAMFERGLMYDWCLSNGNYSLTQYSKSILPAFLSTLK